MTDSQTRPIYPAADAAPEQPEKLLGICQAVGEAVGIKPIYLRIALLLLLMFSPLAMIATYAALGGFVVGSLILFPDTPAESMAEIASEIDREPVVDNVEERQLLAA